MANWALVIGINSYQRLRSLKYAQQDAHLMGDYFLNEARFEQVFYFSDNSEDIEAPDGSRQETQPTYANLLSFLHDFFEQPCLKTGDNFWFFFSGHGLRYLGEDFLVPNNGNPRLIKETTIALSYVTQRLRKSGADNVMLLLDACRNENELGSRGVAIEKQQGVITIASCSPKQESYEIEELKHGSFTYALLEALRIQGEGNCATVERLYQRLRYRVAEINAKYQKPPQTPYAVVEPASKYHLIVFPERATLTDIATLKIDAFKAESKGDWELAKQLWIRVNVVARGNDSDVFEAFSRITQNQTAREIEEDEKKLRRYEQELLKAVEGEYPLSEYVRNGIKSFQQSLGLQDEDVAKISQPILADAEAKYRQKLQEEESQRARQPRQQEKEKQLKIFEFEVVTVNIEKKWLGLSSEIRLNRRSSKAEYFTENLGNGVNLDMVAIPGGQFMMGSPEDEKGRYNYESPQHEVTIQPFFMGKYPITQAQWRAVANLSKVERDLKPNPSNFKGDKRPVEQVSWYDAVEFCKRLSRKTGREYRLPSEAEWEYAIRAGTNTSFHFGETITSELANYPGSFTYADEPEGEYRKKTTDVGSFPPNAFGLYDMHGQVGEWCADDWHDDYQNAPTDGTAWLDQKSNIKVIRGGSWYLYPDYCRSASRLNHPRDGRNLNLGFRVMCVAPRTT